MKNILILLISFILFSCNGTKKIKGVILQPGYGINGIEVEKTKIGDLLEKLGSKFKVDTFFSNTTSSKIDFESPNIKKEIYSIAYSYDSLGLSFYIRPNQQEIFLVSFYSPFKGKTDRGIVLNQSTFRDVIKAYGDTAWEFTDENIIKSYNGIWFYQDFRDTLPITDEKLLPYLDLKVKEISIMKKD